VGVTKKRDPHGSRLHHRVLLNSDATQTQMTHLVVGMMVMMSGTQLSVHGIVHIFWWDGVGIIPSALAIVNIFHEVLIDFDWI